MLKPILLILSHLAAVFVGFAAGIYALPILTAPPPPSSSDVEVAAQDTLYTGRFKRDLKDSDALHWGDGEVLIGRNSIALKGEIAPGPDYKLYLSPVFIETEADFAREKPSMVLVGDVRTFENFIVPVHDSIDPGDFNTVIVWCESFGQFITAAQYR